MVIIYSVQMAQLPHISFKIPVPQTKKQNLRRSSTDISILCPRKKLIKTDSELNLELIHKEIVDVKKEMLEIKNYVVEIKRILEQRSSEEKSVLENISLNVNTQHDKCGKQTATLKQMVKKNIPIDQPNTFPLQSDEDLAKVEKEVANDIEHYIGLIKTIIQPKGILKNFDRLFGESIILDHNFDGVKNKKSMKQYSSLVNAMYKATKRDGYTEADFVKDFRLALKMAKNRIFKRKNRQ